LTGDHLKVFWDCSRILAGHEGDDRKKKIDISLAYGSNGVCPWSTSRKYQRYILPILLLTARKIITANWRNAPPLT